MKVYSVVDFINPVGVACVSHVESSNVDQCASEAAWHSARVVSICGINVWKGCVGAMRFPI